MECTENKDATRYSGVYLTPPQDITDELIKYSSTLLEQDSGLIELEFNPHITILYGLITNNIKEVATALGLFHPIRVMFGKNSMFMSDDINGFDVLKIDMFGVYLNRLRQRLLKLDNKQTYVNYMPHLTLAALKPNYAMDYVGNNPFIGTKFVVDELVFSGADGNKGIIKGDGTITAE